MPPMRDLREFLSLLRREGELSEITVEADPRLEIPEIHRRVIEQGGPALEQVVGAIHDREEG